MDVLLNIVYFNLSIESLRGIVCIILVVISFPIGFSLMRSSGHVRAEGGACRGAHARTRVRIPMCEMQATTLPNTDLMFICI